MKWRPPEVCTGLGWGQPSCACQHHRGQWWGTQPVVALETRSPLWCSWSRMGRLRYLHSTSRSWSKGTPCYPLGFWCWHSNVVAVSLTWQISVNLMAGRSGQRWRALNPKVGNTQPWQRRLAEQVCCHLWEIRDGLGTASDYGNLCLGGRASGASRCVMAFTLDQGSSCCFTGRKSKLVREREFSGTTHLPCNKPGLLTPCSFKNNWRRYF